MMKQNFNQNFRAIETLKSLHNGAGETMLKQERKRLKLQGKDMYSDHLLLFQEYPHFKHFILFIHFLLIFLLFTRIKYYI